uniref:Uncharacterized protein n=1 Tax=Rhizophora mucronata TaxID=61149 RepID=A0A2P2NF28_RHIMU
MECHCRLGQVFLIVGANVSIYLP